MRSLPPRLGGRGPQGFKYGTTSTRGWVACPECKLLVPAPPAAGPPSPSASPSPPAVSPYELSYGKGHSDAWVVRTPHTYDEAEPFPYARQAGTGARKQVCNYGTQGRLRAARQEGSRHNQLTRIGVPCAVLTIRHQRRRKPPNQRPA